MSGRPQTVGDKVWKSVASQSKNDDSIKTANENK